MPVVRPSWFTPEPTITACTRLRAFSADDIERSTTTIAPSARTYPSAEASNGRQSPVGESIDAREKPM